ncbi:MAG: tRNA pseudouridine(38-40) synthase TruA [Melioribacteraceae bacterium]
MPNYKLTIQYDGTDYFGWQSQPDGNTVQDELIRAIEKITQTEINLIGSGRTDAAVHAIGQVANFKIENNLDIFQFEHALNSLIPSSIAIKNINEVDENFHSRFDAKKRSYLYLIAKNKNPFYSKYSYNYHSISKLNIFNLNELSKSLLGEHNFTSFCKRKTDTQNKVCNIYTARWRETKDFFIFKIEANRFLHGMVRTVVGTLLYANSKDLGPKYLLDTLEIEDREAGGEAVPAKGLFLFKVKY